MRILVTGGAGYIGSHAVRLFQARGHEVTVYDNLSAGHRQAVPAECLVVGDLDRVDHLDQVVVGRRIEACVHFAAFANVGESVREPAHYYRNNLVNTLTLMDCLRQERSQEIRLLQHCGHLWRPECLPISEDTPQRPINPYGASKLAVEHALADFARAYDWGFAALRYFNAAGASADGVIGEDHTPETHLIPLILQVCLGQRPHIEVFGTDYPTPDGTCVRDYVHVADLAEAHLLALQALQPGSMLRYNLGIGRGYSVREVIQTVEEVTGRKATVKEVSRRAGDPPALVASSEKIQRELGWRPQYTDLKAIVETAWNWHRTHPRGYKFSQA